MNRLGEELDLFRWIGAFWGIVVVLDCRRRASYQPRAPNQASWLGA
jgi:hypothetical protein